MTGASCIVMYAPMLTYMHVRVSSHPHLLKMALFHLPEDKETRKSSINLAKARSFKLNKDKLWARTRSSHI